MTSEPYPTKRCARCGEEKPHDGFYKDKRRRDGLGSYCKACHLAQVRRWKNANREANNAYRAQWVREDRAANPEKHRAARIKFYASKGPTYQSWVAMITRCTNPNQDSWKYYGGRGITVCDWWRQSFENFLADMGERPAGTTLDRIDCDGHYTPENCRWATATEQSRNQRRHQDREWSA